MHYNTKAKLDCTAQHSTTQHTQHSVAQRIEIHATPHTTSTQQKTTQHNTTQHNTTQHNKKEQPTRAYSQYNKQLEQTEHSTILTHLLQIEIVLRAPPYPLFKQKLFPRPLARLLQNGVDLFIWSFKYFRQGNENKKVFFRFQLS